MPNENPVFRYTAPIQSAKCTLKLIENKQNHSGVFRVHVPFLTLFAFLPLSRMAFVFAHMQSIDGNVTNVWGYLEGKIVFINVRCSLQNRISTNEKPFFLAFIPKQHFFTKNFSLSFTGDGVKFSVLILRLKLLAIQFEHVQFTDKYIFIFFEVPFERIEFMHFHKTTRNTCEIPFFIRLFLCIELEEGL